MTTASRRSPSRPSAGSAGRRPRRRPAGGPQLDQQLGREERAARLDAHALEGLAPEQLAGAVDVADPEAEEDPVGEPVGPGVERPDRRVGALDPEADDDVRVVRLGQARGQPAEVGDPELAVAVGEGDEVVAAAPNPTGARRRSRRLVGWWTARTTSGWRPRAVGDRRGPVARAVVDGDDLERLGERRQDRQRLLDEALEVGLLVVGREEVRQAGDAGRRGRRPARASVAPAVAVTGPLRAGHDAGQEPRRVAVDVLELVASRQLRELWSTSPRIR